MTQRTFEIVMRSHYSIEINDQKVLLTKMMIVMVKKKHRVTILFCYSMKCEKYKLWIIGKSKRPRCLKNFNTAIVSVDYTHGCQICYSNYGVKIWTTTW